MVEVLKKRQCVVRPCLAAMGTSELAQPGGEEAAGARCS